jgi:hypothetical protein
LNSWKQGAQVFHTMPRSSLIAVLTGVAFLFGAFGAVQDAMGVEQGRQPNLIFAIAISGDSRLRFSMAGHLPIFHFQFESRQVERWRADAAAEPLAEIASRIVRNSEAFGPITDDRTILLLRYLGQA